MNPQGMTVLPIIIIIIIIITTTTTSTTATIPYYYYGDLPIACSSTAIAAVPC